MIDLTINKQGLEHNLKKAKENGVHIWAYDCAVTDRSMKLDAPVPVIL